MKRIVQRTVSAILLLSSHSWDTGRLLSQEAYQFEVPESEGMEWFKGNTHTHTLESDGDSPPEVVARWYKSHGYNFLVLSDHNVLVEPSSLHHLVDSTFLLISGEEVTTRFGTKPVHVNGLNIPHAITPRIGATLVETIQANIDAVRKVDGVPHINHPNFGWALDAEVLAQVRDTRLLEIFNGHPLAHNNGGGDSPGLEQIWDRLLTGGKRIYGIAVDDAHHFREEFSPDMSNPGRGWIVVRARSLETHEILHNMEAGNFYASTGVELEDIIIGKQHLEIRIRQKGDFKYHTQFVGDRGTVLMTAGTIRATYRLSGSETYVRARVVDSGGHMAWVQPIFVRRR